MGRSLTKYTNEIVSRAFNDYNEHIVNILSVIDSLNLILSVFGEIMGKYVEIVQENVSNLSLCGIWDCRD
jgi:hypothetical protein